MWSFFNRMAFGVQFLLFPLRYRHRPLEGAGVKRNTCCFVVVVVVVLVCSLHVCRTIIFKWPHLIPPSTTKWVFSSSFFWMWHKSAQSCLEKSDACFYCLLFKSPHVCLCMFSHCKCVLIGSVFSGAYMHSDFPGKMKSLHRLLLDY